MPKRLLLFLVAALIVWSPDAFAQPCCGPISPDGERLAQFLDNSGVEHRWIAGWHIDWLTGERDPKRRGYREAATHCSAFAAAMAAKLGAYVLRPPEHSQELLANAQMRWLRDEGPAQGWQKLPDYVAAQEQANQGMLVLEAFENPDPRRPGHIAVVRPSTKTRARLDRDGPQETQAGEHNRVTTTTASGFRVHHSAWVPGGGGQIGYFAHHVDWSAPIQR